MKEKPLQQKRTIKTIDSTTVAQYTLVVHIPVQRPIIEMMITIIALKIPPGALYGRGSEAIEYRRRMNTMQSTVYPR